jgi:hypothetical protein
MGQGLVIHEDIQEFAAFHSIDIDTANILCRNGNYRCKCGKFKRIISSKQTKIQKSLGAYCGNKECHNMYGKKRPEHSTKMKFNALNGSDKYKSTLIRKGQLYNKQVNSIEFLRKKLTNKGYDCNNLSDSDVLELDSKYRSIMSKSRNTRQKLIIKRFQKWNVDIQQLVLDFTNGIVPTEIYLSSLDDDMFDRIWKLSHGLNTFVFSKNIQSYRSSFFKRERLSNFKYNTKQKSIVTSSGLESEYVKFFEENGIEWEYEPFAIRSIDNDSFYIPDFLIKISDEYILLEVKGAFYRQEVVEYLRNKIGAGIRFAKERGYRFILTQCQPKDDFTFITKSMINEK